MMDLTESEINKYVKRNFLDAFNQYMHNMKRKRIQSINYEIQEHFLEKVEYVKENNGEEINWNTLDRLLREFGNPKKIAREYLAAYENKDVLLISPIIQLFLGFVFILLQLYAYNHQYEFGEFYFLLLIPTVIATLTSIMGLITLIFKKRSGNGNLRLLFSSFFIIAEIITISQLLNLFSLFQILISLILFILLLVFYNLLDYLHELSNKL